MTRHSTHESRFRAVAACQAGATLRDVAAAHGVSHQAVRLWVLAAGGEMRPVGVRRPGTLVGRRRRLEALLAACRAADVDALTPAIREALEALDS